MSATDRLDQIEARANAATKRPWVYGGKNRIDTPTIDADEADWGGEELSGYVIHAQQDAGAWRYADAEFMAHARDDVEWLIEQVRKRDAALQAVLDLHREARNDVDRTPPCPHCHGEPGIHECGCWADEKWPTVCAVCMEGTKGASVEYPCPTVRAIEDALS